MKGTAHASAGHAVLSSPRTIASSALLRMLLLATPLASCRGLGPEVPEASPRRLPGGVSVGVSRFIGGSHGGLAVSRFSECGSR